MLQNQGVHNLSSIILTPAQQLLLSFGLKFIPPCNINKSLGDQVMTSFDMYTRSIRLRKQFVHEESTVPKNLRIPNPAFLPENASVGIENYVNVARRRLSKQVNNYLRQKPPQDPTLQWITDVIASIRALKGIIIKPSDKGYETVIHDLDWYKTECLRQLSDINTYEVNVPHYSLVWAQLRLLLNNNGKLYQSTGPRVLSRLARYLLQLEHKTELRLARFYCITKLHKTPIVGRPIVSSINTATYYASKHLDDRLQKFLHRIPAFIQSSQHLLLILEKTALPPGCVLVAADITSLYPNIPIPEGLIALRAQLLAWGVSLAETTFLTQLAEWVLKNNYLEFASTTYRQISGTAMGTPFAVVFANIFLAHLEQKLHLTLPAALKPLISKRYVDDLFVVCASEASAVAFMQSYNAQYPSIKLTSATGDLVNFMDLRVYKGDRFRISGILDVELYSSGTKKFLYLPPWSFHPSSTFPSFISAERKRVRINCSDEDKYKEHDQIFRQRLLARGYSAEFLQPLFEIVHCRTALLHKAATSVAKNAARATAAVEANPLVFKTQYSQLTKSVKLRHCLKVTRSALDDVDAKSIFSPRTPVMCYTRNKNLSGLLCSSLFK